MKTERLKRRVYRPHVVHRKHAALCEGVHCYPRSTKAGESKRAVMECMPLQRSNDLSRSTGLDVGVEHTQQTNLEGGGGGEGRGGRKEGRTGREGWREGGEGGREREEGEGREGERERGGREGREGGIEGVEGGRKNKTDRTVGLVISNKICEI